MGDHFAERPDFQRQGVKRNDKDTQMSRSPMIVRRKSVAFAIPSLTVTEPRIRASTVELGHFDPPRSRRNPKSRFRRPDLENVRSSSESPAPARRQTVSGAQASPKVVEERVRADTIELGGLNRKPTNVTTVIPFKTTIGELFCHTEPENLGPSRLSVPRTETRSPTRDREGRVVPPTDLAQTFHVNLYELCNERAVMFQRRPLNEPRLGEFFINVAPMHAIHYFTELLIENSYSDMMKETEEKNSVEILKEIRSAAVKNASDTIRSLIVKEELLSFIQEEFCLLEERGLHRVETFRNICPESYRLTEQTKMDRIEAMLILAPDEKVKAFHSLERKMVEYSTERIPVLRLKKCQSQNTDNVEFTEEEQKELFAIESLNIWYNHEQIRLTEMLRCVEIVKMGNALRVHGVRPDQSMELALTSSHEGAIVAAQASRQKAIDATLHSLKTNAMNDYSLAKKVEEATKKEETSGSSSSSSSRRSSFVETIKRRLSFSSSRRNSLSDSVESAAGGDEGCAQPTSSPAPKTKSLVHKALAKLLRRQKEGAKVDESVVTKTHDPTEFVIAAAELLNFPLQLLKPRDTFADITPQTIAAETELLNRRHAVFAKAEELREERLRAQEEEKQRVRDMIEEAVLRPRSVQRDEDNLGRPLVRLDDEDDEVFCDKPQDAGHSEVSRPRRPMPWDHDPEKHGEIEYVPGQSAWEQVGVPAEEYEHLPRPRLETWEWHKRDYPPPKSWGSARDELLPEPSLEFGEPERAGRHSSSRRSSVSGQGELSSHPSRVTSFEFEERERLHHVRRHHDAPPSNCSQMTSSQYCGEDRVRRHSSSRRSSVSGKGEIPQHPSRVTSSEFEERERSKHGRQRRSSSSAQDPLPFDPTRVTSSECGEHGYERARRHSKSRRSSACGEEMLPSEQSRVTSSQLVEHEASKHPRKQRRSSSNAQDTLPFDTTRVTSSECGEHSYERVRRHSQSRRSSTCNQDAPPSNCPRMTSSEFGEHDYERARRHSSSRRSSKSAQGELPQNLSRMTSEFDEISERSKHGSRRRPSACGQEISLSDQSRSMTSSHLVGEQERSKQHGKQRRSSACGQDAPRSSSSRMTSSQYGEDERAKHHSSSRRSSESGRGEPPQNSSLVMPQEVGEPERPTRRGKLRRSSAIVHESLR